MSSTNLPLEEDIIALEYNVHSNTLISEYVAIRMMSYAFIGR